MILAIASAEDVGEDLTEALSARGHRLTSYRCALSGLRAALNDAPDVVLLGIGLTGLAVTHLLAMLRAVSDVPVIVVVPPGAEQVVVRVLELGADTVLVQPLGADELAARVQAVLRRGRGQPYPAARRDVIAVGGLVLDQRARTAQLNGVALDLARREFDLLWALARRSGAVATRRELLAEVWHCAEPSGHTLSVHLSRIREKLGETAAAPKLVHIVRGVGLRLADQQRAITPGIERHGTLPPELPSVASVCLVDDGHQPGRTRVERSSSVATSGAA